jgi:hypothetical protein
MSAELNFREPTPTEKELLQRLLEADFEGKTELSSQLQRFRVRQIDTEGSLEIDPGTNVDKAPVKKRIPVEAEGADEDGTHVHVLLHVVNGVVKELEIYKDDGSPIIQLPSSRDLKLLVLPP